MVRTKTEKQVIHQEWLECSEICTDVYWSNKFKEASINKFPRGCSYVSGLLSFWSKKENDTIQLTTSDFQQMIIDSAVFFERNCSLKSSKTKNKERQAVVITVWSKCNDINKGNMMSEYVSAIAGAYSLTIEQTIQLRNTIRAGMVCKIVKVDEIQDNRIISLSGLQFDPETMKFYFISKAKISNDRHFTKKCKKKPQPKVKLSTYESKWINYCTK